MNSVVEVPQDRPINTIASELRACLDQQRAAYFVDPNPDYQRRRQDLLALKRLVSENSDALIDAINRFRRDGMQKKEAIVAAGRIRIRPIVMTSATTILALLPLTLGFGEGASLRSPMALAVIGGLVTSTILTLIVIPCVYSALDRSR